jgi:hypothetical protein
MELLATRLSPQAGKSLVIPLEEEGTSFVGRAFMPWEGARSDPTVVHRGQLIAARAQLLQKCQAAICTYDLLTVCTPRVDRNVYPHSGVHPCCVVPRRPAGNSLRAVSTRSGTIF